MRISPLGIFGWNMQARGLAKLAAADAALTQGRGEGEDRPVAGHPRRLFWDMHLHGGAGTGRYCALPSSAHRAIGDYLSPKKCRWRLTPGGDPVAGTRIQMCEDGGLLITW